MPKRDVSKYGRSPRVRSSIQSRIGCAIENTSVAPGRATRANSRSVGARSRT